MNQVRELLAVLADAPAPVSRVDIELARRRGRRVILFRRVGVAGSAAVAVIAVVMLVGAVTGGGFAGFGPAPIGNSPVPATSPTAAVALVAPKEFDPLTQYVDFGWLPDGASSTTISTGRDWQRLAAVYPPPARDKKNPWVALWVVSAGKRVEATRPEQFAVGPTETRSGPATDPPVGTRVPWTDPSVSYTAATMWLYAPDAMAVVAIGGDWPDGGDLVDRVARNVWFGVDKPIRLPVTVGGLPPSFELTSLSANVGTIGADWSATINYGSTATNPDSGWPMSVFAANQSHDLSADANTSLDGHKARTSGLPDGGERLQVYDVDGVYLDLMTNSPWATAALEGGLKGVFRAMTIHPDPRDWT